MIGRTISDYRTEEKLGGEIGVVYKVKDTSRGRSVVLNFHPKKRFRTARRRL